MMGTATTPPTAEEAARNIAAMGEMRERIDQAIDELVTLADYIESDSKGWSYAALRNVVRRWQTLDPADAFWYALSELASDDYHSGFDRGLRKATVRILAAADKASVERWDVMGQEVPYLTVHTFRQLEVAYEQIGQELDRIRREA